MISVSPLILSILPLIAKASFHHASARLLLSKPPQCVITSNLRVRNVCRSCHNHSLHLTRATTAPTTTTLQLLRQHKFPPHHNCYTNCQQHAMPTSNSDHKVTDDSSTSGNNNNNNCNYNCSQMKILGICGGIGSGKSTASQIMVTKLGCADLIDADKLAHAVYEPGSLALDEIVDEFGTDILLNDDTGGEKMIDRKKLGAIVFKDAKSMSKLEQIVWPHVRMKLEECIQEITLKHQHQRNQQPPVTDSTNDAHNNEQNSKTLTSTSNVIIVEAALLLETDWHDLLDGLWVVHSSQEVATSRLINNRGMTKDEALLRIRAQRERKGIVVSDGNDCEVAGFQKALNHSSTAEPPSSPLSLQQLPHHLPTAIITNDGSLDDLETALRESLYDPKSFKIMTKEKST